MVGSSIPALTKSLPIVRLKAWKLIPSRPCFFIPHFTSNRANPLEAAFLESGKLGILAFLTALSVLIRTLVVKGEKVELESSSLFFLFFFKADL